MVPGIFPAFSLEFTVSKLTTPNGPQPTAYLRAVSTPINEDQRDVMRRPTWVPEPWAPVRPGADDHKQHKSFGTKA